MIVLIPLFANVLFVSLFFRFAKERRKKEEEERRKNKGVEEGE